MEATLTCPNCSHENPGEARFCSNCGHSLAITCPVCSHPAEPGDRFCTNCGNPLTGEEAPAAAAQDDLSRYIPEELLAKMRSARAGKAMLGERRTVTMLFADVTGSTAAAEQFDPEDWAEIMNGAFASLIAPIYRYEGTLAQLRGDAVLAFFGAPIAHEDDPIRALRAGLEMVKATKAYSATVEDKWGIPLQIRVGVNTGLVVVGEVGSDLRVEYTALGDAINVAARMEQTAEPGTVQVSEETYQLTGGAFSAEEIGGVEVKGKSEPVTTYRIVGFVGTRLAKVGHPIVGREPELAKLESMRTRLAQKSGWVASIIADAGVGKSRLINEFRNQIEDQQPSIDLMSGVSRSYDRTSPYATVKDVLDRLWHLDGSDSDYGAIEQAVNRLGLEDPDLPSLLANIVGVASPSDQQAFLDALGTPLLSARSAAALVSYVAAAARHRPTVIMLEDLHWADDLSLALIENLMELAESVPLGLLFSMRPYRDEPAWRIHEVAEREHHHRYETMSLAPLDPDSSVELLDGLLAGDLEEGARLRILKRADGNPLFIEEIARSLAEAGDLGGAAVPATITSTLTARLDRLDDAAKYVIQNASVLGADFDRSMLSVLVGETTVDNALPDLLRRGILVEKAEGLGFRHALIQETAYDTILRRTRRQLHKRVADHLIETQREVTPEIARHLIEADEKVAAFPYLVQAGGLAARTMALADAIRLFTTALENVPDDADPELVESAHDGLGGAYSLVPDLTKAAAAYQQLFEFGEKAARPSTKVSALNRLAYATASVGGDLEKAESYLADARDLALDLGDDFGMAEYHMNSCFVASMAGRVKEAVLHDEETVVLGEKNGDMAVWVSGLFTRAINYVNLVDLENGEPAVEVALEQARETGNEELVGVLEAWGVGGLAYIKGDPQPMVDQVARIGPILERYGSFHASITHRTSGGVIYETGDLESALAHFAECVRLADMAHQNFIAGGGRSGMALVYATAGMTDPIPELTAAATAAVNGPIGDFIASSIYADLGYVNLMAGDLDGAVELFDLGLRKESTFQNFDRPRILVGLALAKREMGEHELAAEHIAASWEFVKGRGFMPPRPFMTLTEAMLAFDDGDLHSAEELLGAAQQQAMEMGQRLNIARILQMRARVAVAAGRQPDAAEFESQAVGTVEAIAASMADETLKESFLRKWRTPVAEHVGVI